MLGRPALGDLAVLGRLAVERIPPVAESAGELKPGRNLLLPARGGVTLVVVTVVVVSLLAVSLLAVSLLAVPLLADGAVLVASDVERAGAVLRGRAGLGGGVLRAVTLGPAVLGIAVLGIAVLFPGGLGAAGLRAGTVSLDGAAIRIGYVLGLLGGLTVLVDGVLRVARLRGARLRGGPLDVGWVRLPCLPVLVIGRLLAGAVASGRLGRLPCWPTAN